MSIYVFAIIEKTIHAKDPKPSGGVAILVKQTLLIDFQVSVIDSTYDGILVLEVKHKLTQCNLVFSIYLPENSSAHINACTFFEHLLSFYIYIQMLT